VTIGRSDVLSDLVLDSVMVPGSVSRKHFIITRNSLASTSSSSHAPYLIEQKPTRNSVRALHSPQYPSVVRPSPGGRSGQTTTETSLTYTIELRTLSVG
jgi:hypothetical protein